MEKLFFPIFSFPDLRGRNWWERMIREIPGEMERFGSFYAKYLLTFFLLERLI